MAEKSWVQAEAFDEALRVARVVHKSEKAGCDVHQNRSSEYRGCYRMMKVLAIGDEERGDLLTRDTHLRYADMVRKWAIEDGCSVEDGGP
jgi:hypothetical protein